MKLAVLSALSLVATQVYALGFESLPVSGFAVASGGAGSHQPTGGTTAYKICNGTGNYGSTSTGATVPTTTANNTCAIVPSPSSITTSPVAGFTVVPFASALRNIVMNNALTNNTNITVGTLQDVVFRNADKTECIYATQLSLSGVDYDLTQSGTQYFEVNGIARGGFSASGTVTAAYAPIAPNSDVVYRAGRTFTSVQHRPIGIGSPNFAPGYYNLPLVAPGYNLSINGLNGVGGTPTLAQQSASINDNWVEFTTHAYWNLNGNSRNISPAVYVKAACTSSSPTAVSNAIRIRQTRGRFIEVNATGYVPPGGNTLPAPVVPY